MARTFKANFSPTMVAREPVSPRAYTSDPSNHTSVQIVCPNICCPLPPEMLCIVTNTSLMASSTGFIILTVVPLAAGSDTPLGTMVTTWLCPCARPLSSLVRLEYSQGSSSAHARRLHRCSTALDLFSHLYLSMEDHPLLFPQAYPSGTELPAVLNPGSWDMIPVQNFWGCVANHFPHHNSRLCFSVHYPLAQFGFLKMVPS